MKRYIIMLAGFAVISMASAQDCSDLFISEYLEGSGNNKGIEVYNPTSEIINLGSYYIARYSNGSNTYTGGGITRLEGFIQPYGTHFVVNGQTTSTETSPASDPALRALSQQLDHDYPAPTYMNGNDAIALFKDPVGSGNDEDFQVLDLFGIVGGGMISSDEGWASHTDTWIYRNNYNTEGEITGKDSAYISNYIIPDGYYFYTRSLWSANHSLVRKPSVKRGVTVETMPTIEFIVTTEWDTVPGGQDQWDSINTHYCNCEHGTAVDLKKIDSKLSIYPNPAQGYVNISSVSGIDEIEFFDISGKLITSFASLQGTREKRIDLGDFDKGVYFIRARSGSITTTRKLLVQ